MGFNLIWFSVFWPNYYLIKFLVTTLKNFDELSFFDTSHYFSNNILSIKLTFSVKSRDLGMSKCIGNVWVTKQPFCQETCQSCFVIVWLDRENFTIYGLEKKKKARICKQLWAGVWIIQVTMVTVTVITLPQVQSSAITGYRREAFQQLAAWFLQ